MEATFLTDFVGILGAIGYLASYAILQFKREFAHSVYYSLANFCSASLVAFSLLFAFNIASMIIQVAWIIISSYGIYVCLKNTSSNK